MSARPSPFVAAVGLMALLAAACTSDDAEPLGTAEVVAAEVVQTIAAAAELEPAGRVTVNAPAGGEVAELLVGDGDVVAAGDPLVRLVSDPLEQQVAQAEAAVAAADALVGVAGSAGFDLSPLLGAFRTQLDAVFPPVLQALGDQLDLLEAALTELPGAGSLTPVTPPGSPIPMPEGGSAEDDGSAGDGGSSGEGGLPGGDGFAGDGGLPGGDGFLGDGGLPGGDGFLGGELPSLIPPAPQVDREALEAAVADARQRLAAAEAGYVSASNDLGAAASQARSQAEGAAAGQVAAAEAQRDQAALALEVVRARVDDLTIIAPAAGVVELSRAGSGGEASSGLGGLGGDLGGVGDLGGLLGGGGGGGVSSSGAVAEGVAVGSGQPLLTIFDLSGFTARVEVDEIDVVEVSVGQPVTVLIDAYPDAELRGVVTFVALSPQRLPTGGSVYPVTVELIDVPVDVALRIGFTASAEIEVRRIEAGTVVPTAALLRRGGDEVVYVVRDDIAVEIPVRVVAIGEDTAAIEGGVAAGDVVVTTGVELVVDGDTVETP